MVVGILKPSITFGSLSLLQLTPVHSSSLQLTPTCSPVHSSLLPPCPLAPYTPQVAGTPTHTWPLGASWSELGASWSELGVSWSELGVSWSKLGVSWSELEWGGSKGSDLGVRGASFILLPCCPLAPCPQRWWRPQYIVSCSLDIGNEVQRAGSEGSDSRDLGVRGVIWEWGEPASTCSHVTP